jgi:hypothetical protein
MCGFEPWSESLTRSLLEGMVRKGTGVDTLNCLLSLPSFLPPLSGPDAGLCRQGQRPKTVDATIKLYTFVISQLDGGGGSSV